MKMIAHEVSVAVTRRTRDRGLWDRCSLAAAFLLVHIYVYEMCPFHSCMLRPV